MQSNSQFDTETSATCEVCGFAAAKLRNIPRIYGKGSSLIVIENVPVISCPNCGESYMSAKTAKAIARLRRAGNAEQRSLPVTRFSA